MWPLHCPCYFLHVVMVTVKQPVSRGSVRDPLLLSALLDTESKLFSSPGKQSAGLSARGGRTDRRLLERWAVSLLVHWGPFIWKGHSWGTWFHPVRMTYWIVWMCFNSCYSSARTNLKVIAFFAETKKRGNWGSRGVTTTLLQSAITSRLFN